MGLALVGAFWLGLAGVVAFALHQADARLMRQEMERRKDLRFALLRAALREYDSALFSIGLLAQNSARLQSDEFEHAASLILSRLGGVQAVQWIPLVPGSELSAFSARLDELHGAPVPLRERSASGDIRPVDLSSPRAEHAFIAYCHPLAGNEGALGYDVFTAPNAATLARARTFPGQAALSTRFTMVQGGDGVVFCLFVPRAVGDVGPPEAGPGFIQVVLRLDKAFSQFFRFSSNTAHDILITDITDKPVPLYLQRAGGGDPQLHPPGPLQDFTPGPHTLSRDLPVGGRLWRVTFRGSPEWIDARRTEAPWLALLGGGLLAAISMAYLNSVARQTTRIRRVVAERTAELAENRALLEEIIDHNPNVIWVKDSSFRYQLVNLSFSFIYGRNRADIIGRSDEILHGPEIVSAMQAVDARILASGETVSFEENYPMPGGRRTFLVSKFPLRRPDSSIYAVAGIATDITALRETETRQLATERRLHEAQKLESLGVLAGGVAHDFNNLLTGILGHANLVRALLPGDHSAHLSLGQIETASQRAAELCRQMLAYSGHGRVAVRRVDVGELVRETAGLLKVSLAEDARLNFDLPDGLPGVIADATQLRQIVMNLVLNASEALPENGGEITLRTRLVEADAELFSDCVFAPELPAGAYVELEVSDTGCGMPPAVLSRIFDPFFTTKFTGRGLGLASVLGIVRGHHGALRVRSSPGAGTTFLLYFPAGAPVPAAPETTPRAAPPSGFRLLVVDDDCSSATSIAAFARTCGHSVDAYPAASDALNRFLASPQSFHAAIMAFPPPRTGGASLLDRLRQNRPDLPVLLAGSPEPAAELERCLSRPGVRFQPRPVALEDLRSSLDALLGREG